jgi:DNA (cytosine-5)-methyltransferase 1
MTSLVVDLYAGPGGWDEGMRNAGITDVVGVEIEPNACATAEAAGHKRVQADVSTIPIGDYAGAWGLVASPPCQAWSMAGSRKGEQDRARVHALIDAYVAGCDDIGDGWADPRSHHAAQPIRWVRELRPEWVCFEQVPPVLGLWQHAADVLRRWGYRTWAGVLNSADYGVPQTRERAVLMARLGRPVHPPVATHAKEPEGADLFGGELLPWVSMAEALGWGLPTQPSPVVMTARGRQAGDSDVLRGSSWRPEWWQRQIAQGNWTLRNGSQANSTARTAVEPAPTLAFGNNAARCEWVLQSRRDSPEWVARHGGRENRDAEQPAVTITGEAHRWTWGRPATTVDPRIAPPGHRDRAGGERQHEQSVRVTVQEAAALQSFPADYPWHGTKTAQFLQVGNAVPPRLAEAIVRAVAA